MMNLSSNVVMFWVIAIPAVLPALLMVAAHYFPWSLIIGRPLNLNTARVYGVSGILIPVMIAVGLADTLGVTLSAWQTVSLTWMAAISAGTATISAYHLDHHTELHHRLTDEQHRSKALKDAKKRD